MKERVPPIPRRLDETSVRQIRIYHQQANCSYRLLADVYGCSHSTIEHVIRHKGAYKNFATDY